MQHPPLTLQQVLEHLLNTNAPELALPAILSVELPGPPGEPSQVVFVPLTHLEQLTQPLHVTPDGLCPAASLPADQRAAPVAYRAGQLLFTYILPNHV